MLAELNYRKSQHLSPSCARNQEFWHKDTVPCALVVFLLDSLWLAVNVDVGTTFPKRLALGKVENAKCKQINEKTGRKKEGSPIFFGKVTLVRQ